MKSRLGPELQQTQEEFIEALSEGVEVAEAMVNGLAVEAEALAVYAETWQGFEDNVMDFAQMISPTVSADWFEEVPVYKADIENQLERTAGRHAYASWMLMNISSQSE